MFRVGVVALGALLFSFNYLSAQTVSRESPAFNPTTAGYRGIWFTLGQFYGHGSGDQPYSAPSKSPTFPFGDKYSGGLGTYTAKHTSLAIYRPEVDKTFFVYGGTTVADERHLLCMISYYDHRTGTVPRPVVVFDKEEVLDPHDNPSLSIDALGHLWVFVSGRGTLRPGRIFRSAAPYDISHFDPVSVFEFTYPQPHYSTDQGFLHLFTRYSGVRELYWSSSSDGHNWAPVQKLAGIRETGDKLGGHYQTSAIHGNTVGTFFNRHPNGVVDARTDLYYMQTTDHGKTWSTIDGQLLSTPLATVSSPARVADYASVPRNVYLKDMAFDQNGHPVLLYLTSLGHEPGPPNAPRYFQIVRWNGESWIHTKVTPTDHNYDMGSLYLAKDEWTVRVPSDPGPQPDHSGGDIVIWKSIDNGATWQRDHQITHSGPRNHNYARRPINAKDPFFTFWADGDPTSFSRSQLFFSDSTGTKVWQLPYDMTNDSATPLLLP